MPKRSKRAKQEPNIVVFLVEGESDKIALELPLSDLIDQKHPDYEVRFLLQERKVNQTGIEVEDAAADDKDEEGEDFTEEELYDYGGDITTSSFVTPDNIEVKITNRFIMPAVRKEGIYPKRIAKVIHIVDLDGAFVPDACVVPFAPAHQDRERPYYDGEQGVIEAADTAAIIGRNRRKRSNLEYLLGLSEIKVKTKKIPYEVYFFSSNMDHFINHDANVEGGKKKLADSFMRSYGLDTDAFVSFFQQDPGSLGHMGYAESWAFIRKESNSVKRFTNIDCLIHKLMIE